MFITGIFIFLLVAKLQDFYADRAPAWKWAFGYALISGLLDWRGLMPFVFGVVIVGLYAWGYFVLLRRFTDNLLLWIAIYLGGVALPVLIPLMFLK